MTGSAREDVSAKAVAMNTSRGSFNLAKVTDSLNRTDHMLVRNILDLVQGFYTDPRVINVVSDRMTGQMETIEVNMPAPTPENPDALLNDLTLGEYDAVVTSTPVRETLEDSQFQQALSLRELGIPIPDETLLENSRLLRKTEIIAKMKAAAEAPEAVAKRELEKTAAELEVANLKAEAARVEADAMLKQAKANEVATPKDDGGAEMAKAQFDMEAAREKHQMEMEKLRAELEFTRQENELKLQQMQREGMMKVASKQAEAFMSANEPETEEE
jgi:hypothetical protein